MSTVLSTAAASISSVVAGASKLKRAFDASAHDSFLTNLRSEQLNDRSNDEWTRSEELLL